MSVHALGPSGFAIYTYQQLITAPFSWIEDEAIWEFLYRKVHEANTPNRYKYIACDPNSIDLWEQFRKQSGSMRPAWKLRHHFVTKLAPFLHNAHLSGEAKVKLYFGLGIPINLDYLEELRNEAEVDVDRYRRMTRFSHGVHHKMHLTFPANARPYIVMQERVQMLMFLCERVHDPVTGEVRKPDVIPTEAELWNEYKERTNTPYNVHTLKRLFRDQVVPYLIDTVLDVITKANLCFALRIPVYAELLQQFEDVAKVQLDDRRRLQSFEDRYGYRLKLQDNHQPARVQVPARFTEAEECKMYTFVFKKIQNQETHTIKRDRSALSSKLFWNEFNEQNSVDRDPNVYLTHFKDVMLPVIHLVKMPNLMKMGLLFALEYPPQEDLLKELRKTGIIEVDKRGCIVAYRERNIKQRVVDAENNEIIDLENDGPEANIPKNETDNLNMDEVQCILNEIKE